jgi:lipopolysaccharide biosynthesis glycosyltransferase
LDGGLSEADRKALLRTVRAKNIEIQFIKIQEQAFFKDMLVWGHVPIASYYRFMLPNLVSQDVKKIIYLDSDLIVSADIGKLWDIDIGERHLLAVQEQGANVLYVSSEGALLNYKELGINATEKYFNAGVLVINLARWREDDIGSKAIRYVRDHKEHVRWWDQDALNAVLAYKWGELDHRWNLLSQIFKNPAWEDGPVKDREQYLRLIHHPYIIHFNTWSKPWQNGCRHPFARLFLKYLRKTHYWPLSLRLSYHKFLSGIPLSPVKEAVRKILPKQQGAKGQFPQ